MKKILNNGRTFTVFLMAVLLSVTLLSTAKGEVDQLDKESYSDPKGFFTGSITSLLTKAVN